MLWTAEQLRSLADLAALHAGEPALLDSFAGPGRHGVVVASFGDTTYAIGEDGYTIDHATGEAVEIEAVLS